MDKQVIEMLTEILNDIKNLRSELTELRTDVCSIQTELNGTVKNEVLSSLQTDIRDIKGTVNRIEASQKDAISMLKLAIKNTETEFNYYNHRITDIDKRVFNLENQAER